MYTGEELKIRGQNLEYLIAQSGHRNESLKEQVRKLFKEVVILRSRIEFLERENKKRLTKENNKRDVFQPNEVSIPSFDERLFKKLTPKGIHGMYGELKMKLEDSMGVAAESNEPEFLTFDEFVKNI